MLTGEFLRLAGRLPADRAAASVQSLAASHEGLGVSRAVARQRDRCPFTATWDNLQQSDAAQQLHLQGA